MIMDYQYILIIFEMILILIYFFGVIIVDFFLNSLGFQVYFNFNLNHSGSIDIKFDKYYYHQETDDHHGNSVIYIILSINPSSVTDHLQLMLFIDITSTYMLYFLFFIFHLKYTK